ncbi:MAG TPA: ATP-binding protein [Nitrospira sp.]|nr:ATP-binding protein [Nitrospira sp.]
MADSRPSYDPQALLNAQPVMVAVIDPVSYTIQFQNKTGLEKLGDLAGRKCYETIAGCPAPCAFCKMPEALRTGSVTVNEVPLPNNRHLLIQWSQAVTSEGRVHVIETITDVTEHKRMEEAARTTEKMEALGRLAGGMAHDINNLLTIVVGASEQLSAHSSGATPLVPIQRMQKAVERAGELTRCLVAFSHHQILEPSLVDLNDILRDVEPQVRTLAGEGIAVEFKLHEQPLPILADRQQLSHIITVLVSNARAAMSGRGRLIFSTTVATIDKETAQEHNLQPGAFVQCTVQDTGCGIPADMLPHLFEPFFARMGEAAGRGLGLPSVYGIVRQMGGFIAVTSQAGAGTLFTISLPRAEDPRAVRGRTPHEPASIDRPTVLLVEDDEDVRVAVSDMLKVAGYLVEEACDGMDALRRLSDMALPPHLVLTDVMMPRMTGPQLTAKLEELFPGVRVLYMSGYSDHVLRSPDGRRLACIAKPFSSRDLIGAIQGSLKS